MIEVAVAFDSGASWWEWLKMAKIYGKNNAETARLYFRGIQ